MKDYEIYSTMKVPKNSNIIIRLDGRKFHSLSKALNLVKPYDENFYKIIENVCLDIFNQFAPKFIYAFSDEISILLDEIPFSGRVEKINSVFASLASSSFTYNLLNDYSNEFDLDNLSDNELIQESFQSMMHLYLTTSNGDKMNVGEIASMDMASGH